MTWPAGVPPKEELRRRLVAAYPWVRDDDLGPRSVDAGECERCGAEARLVQTCGPGGGQLGRRCATVDDWCEGHEADAVEALRWLSALPDEADDVARVWWLATGEVRPGSGREGVIATLEEDEGVGAARRLLDGQHLPQHE